MRQRFSGGFSKQARFTRFLKKDMSVFKLVLGLKLGNYMIFNGINLFSRNEDFGETHQKSHFLLILTI